MLRRWVFSIGMSVAAAVAVEALQQLVPHFPPPEASVYDILDLGPAPAVPCSCVPNPFALPAYRPGWGYGSGPAVPLENAPISDADRRTNREWFQQEEEMARRVSDDALTGNPHAALAFAMHLSARTVIFGDDARVEEDAVRWLTLAAQQGHPDAFRLLGHRYAVGRGVKQDYAVAAYWFDQGARHNDPISMAAVGFLHAAGRGVPQDWAIAMRWWAYAETRTPIASRFVGDQYACGAGVAENKERALAAYKRFAGQDPSSNIQLGHMYASTCAPPDDKAALAAFRRAADQGYPDAQIELSELLRRGRGDEPNTLEAYLWARLAERRLPEGDLKKRAAASAAAAARLMSTLELSTQDEMVNAMITSTKPLR
jgi:TPR repeat protein